MSAFDNITNLNSLYNQTRGLNSLIEATKYSRINDLYSSAFNRINHFETLHQSSIQKTAESIIEAQRRFVEPMTAAAKLHRSSMSSIENAMKPMIGAEKLWRSTMQKSMETMTEAQRRFVEPMTAAAKLHRSSMSSIENAMKPMIGAEKLWRSTMQKSLALWGATGPMKNFAPDYFLSDVPTQAGIDRKRFDPYPDSEFEENVDPDSFAKRLSIEMSMIEEELKLQEEVQDDTPSPKGSLNNLSSSKSNWCQEKLKTMRYLIPIKYREEVLGDFLETRNKLKLDGHPNWWINFISFLQISTIAWSVLRRQVSDHVNPSQDTSGDS